MLRRKLIKYFTNRSLLLVILILLVSNLAFSGDHHRYEGLVSASREGKEGKLSLTSVNSDAYSYVLGQIQEGIRWGTDLDFSTFHNKFAAATLQNGWTGVNLDRANIIGNKRVAALEILSGVLSAWDTFIIKPLDMPHPTTDLNIKFNYDDSFKGYIKRQLTRALGNVNPSLKATRQQKGVIVRTVTQMGQQEARRNPSVVKNPRLWSAEFNAGRDYYKLERSLRRDIFFKTLIAYTAQEGERHPEDKDVEDRALTAVYNSYTFDPEVRPKHQSELREILRRFQRHTEVLLSDSSQILDQRGGIVTALIEEGKNAASESLDLSAWKAKFTAGREYKGLNLPYRQDVFFRTLIAYAAQQKTLAKSKDNNLEVERQAVEEVSAYFMSFDHQAVPEDLFTKLQYFQGLKEKKVLFYFDAPRNPLTVQGIGRHIGSFLDPGSRLGMVLASKELNAELKAARGLQLSQLIGKTNFDDIYDSGSVLLGPIFKLLDPGDAAYIKALIEEDRGKNLAEVEARRTHRDTIVKKLYLDAVAQGSKRAIESVNLKALIGSSFFAELEEKEREGYLEDRVKKGDLNARKRLNLAAFKGLLGFTDLTKVKQYLERNAKEGDEDAQHQLNRSASEGSLSSSIAEIGREYLEKLAAGGNDIARAYLKSVGRGNGWLSSVVDYLERLAIDGDENAQASLNQAYKEGKAYLKQRVSEGDRNAQEYLNLAALQGRLGFRDLKERRQYLEDQARTGDSHAQECLNWSASGASLDFTAETGRKHLEDRAAVGDMHAQKLLNQAAFEGRLGFTAETGQKHLEDRAAVGDMHAQKLLNKAASEGKLGFTAEEGQVYLERRLKKGDLHAKLLRLENDKVKHQMSEKIRIPVYASHTVRQERALIELINISSDLMGLNEGSMQD